MDPAHPSGDRRPLRGPAPIVAALAVGGSGLGVLLTAARSGHAGGCAGAARRLGNCVSAPTQALLGARPFVTAALVGLLLGVLIAIAAVLAWREAVDQARGRGVSRPRARSGSSSRRSPRGGLAPRPHH